MAENPGGSAYSLGAMSPRSSRTPTSPSQPLLDIARSTAPDQALRESEEHFRALVENVGDVVSRYDRDCRFLYANPACYGYTGLHPEAFIGKTHDELGLAPDGWRWDEVIRRVYSTGKAEEHKGAIQLHRGSFTFNWRVFPEFAPDGSVRGVVSVARDITAQEKIAQQLAQQSRRLRAVSRRLVEIQEAERRRLSGELHDLLGQNLTALGINLDIVRGELPPALPAALTQRVTSMRAIVGEMVDTVRMVVSDLRPASLDNYGLAGALHSYAQVFTERTRFEVRIAARGSEVRLGSEVELALFRIAQEALQNAAKHSGAQGAHIELIGEPGVVRMIIADDG
ncbi:MAG: PAS domain S-box protein [Betaproteobacteria bacterium]|nr:PAS domain S-box protein [Betaproteobacteria bacterium]